MGKFVRCVNNSEYVNWLTVGKVYELVEKPEYETNQYYVTTDEGKRYGFYKWRFEDVKISEQMIAEIMI